MLGSNVGSSELIAKDDSCLSWANDVSFSPEDNMDVCFEIAELVRRQMLGYIDAISLFLLLMTKNEYSRAVNKFESVIKGLTALMKKTEHFEWNKANLLETLVEEDYLTLLWK
jgi:hypothetical protein